MPAARQKIDEMTDKAYDQDNIMFSSFSFSTAYTMNPMTMNRARNKTNLIKTKQIQSIQHNDKIKKMYFEQTFFI